VADKVAYKTVVRDQAGRVNRTRLDALEHVTRRIAVSPFFQTRKDNP